LARQKKADEYAKFNPLTAAAAHLKQKEAKTTQAEAIAMTDMKRIAIEEVGSSASEDEDDEDVGARAVASVPVVPIPAAKAVPVVATSPASPSKSTPAAAKPLAVG
jgi:hypothetical protein